KFCGKLTPKAPFTIKSADVDWATGMFEIQLDNLPRDPDHPDNRFFYSVQINDGNRLVYDDKDEVLKADQNMIAIPLSAEELDKIKQGGGKMAYAVLVTIREEGIQQGISVPYNAPPHLPPPIGPLDALADLFRNNPPLLGLLAAIVLIGAAALYF